MRRNDIRTEDNRMERLWKRNYHASMQGKVPETFLVRGENARVLAPSAGGAKAGGLYQRG